MQYRTFGRTGVRISALGFGAMRLPTVNVNGKTHVDFEESARMMRRAFELGVNYFDTAPYYCDKESESAVGRALKGIRDKVYISTKNPIESASGADWRRRLEHSLRELDTDYIDFYHMWGINLESYRKEIDVPDGPLEAARRAKEEGLIRHISFSFHDAPENLLTLIDTGNFETVLCQYNLLDRSNEAGIAHAHEKGLGVVIMGPVGGGRLGAPSPVIQSLLPGRKWSTAETALRFVISNPGVSCALSGMSTMEQVEENAKTASIEASLSPDELEAVANSMEENKRLAELYCTGCGYCMPCPNDVNIPANFRFMNYHRVYGLTDFARAEYAAFGRDEWHKGEPASACIECGLCEEKCPQHLQIREQLKETAKALG